MNKARTAKTVIILGLVVILIGVGLGAGLYALTGGTDDDPAPARPSTPQAAPSKELDRFYSQEVTWEDCGPNQCTTLIVPLSYSDPGGPTIELKMNKVAATSDEDYQGPLLLNPGGPGGSGMEYAAAGALAVGPTLSQHFDLIGLDPRGVGSSTPVDCLSDEELDAYMATDASPDDQAEIDELMAQNKAMGEGCRAKSGDLVDHVSTVEAARDMDVVRGVLGVDTLNYFGASYGTKLGSTYAALFPERVGRFVLDGAMDPTLSGREISLGQAGGFKIALEAYADDCAADDECSLGESREEVMGTISDLLASIDEEPLPAGDRELTIGNAMYGLIMPLYNKDYWFLLTTALERAVEGDGSGLMTNFDLYAGRSPSGYTSNQSEAIGAVSCLDDPTFLEPDEIPEVIPEFTEKASLMGPMMAWGLTGCSGFDSDNDEPEVDFARTKDAAPILVIGTTRDPATPMEWATALSELLPTSILITRDGDGHTGFNAGNSCVDDLVTDYLMGKNTPTADQTC